MAKRAASAASLGRALVGADVAMLVVAEAVVAGGPATAQDVDALLGTDDLIGVVEAIDRLRSQGVVVVDQGIASPVGALGDLLHRPLGLGPSFVELADHLRPEVLDQLATATKGDSGHRSTTVRAVAQRLTDPDIVGDLLDPAPPGTDDLLGQLTAARSPAIPLPAGFAYRRIDPEDPLGWLLMTGLVIPVAERGAELPRELVIAAHPDGLAPGAALRSIDLETEAGLSVGVVAGTAAAAADRAIDGAEALLRMADRGEISVRKAGGIGPREIGRLARTIDAEVEQVAMLLELLSTTRLIRIISGSVKPTELTARWWALTRRRRYLSLVRAWIASDHFLSRGLAKTDASGAETGPVALGAREPVAATASARRVTLETLAQVEPDRAWNPDQVAAAIVWQAPNLWGPGEPPPETLVRWTVDEAELLGLVAAESPGPILRALVAGDDTELERACSEAVADDQSTIVLQNDLTAMTLGPLAPDVARPLAEMADREVGDDQNLIYRFSETSIRRAFDTGWISEDLLAFLTQHALAGVPQPLSYLIDDVARRHGSIRVSPAGTVIVTADEVEAVEIASHRRAAEALRLRLIAPTVLTSPVEPIAVAEILRSAGFAPMVDGAAVQDRASADRDTSAEPGHDDGLPADWIGPPLPVGPLTDEVADAVANLVALAAETSTHDNRDPSASAGSNPASPSDLAALWGRPVRLVWKEASGDRAEATGVLIGLGDTAALLTTTGVAEVPIAAIVEANHVDQA